MNYKAGDRVKIKSLDWYNENKDEDGIVELSTHVFTPGMSQFCGKIVTIEDVFEDTDDNVVYYIEEIGYDWTDEMIEGLVEEEMPLDKAGQMTDFEYEGLTYALPNGYIFKDENGNVINATKIVLEKKKKEYPKTYEECCKVLNTDDDSIIDISVPLHYNHLLISFTQLLICRDAYWKLYGEEMGLGKDLPWVPDWMCIDPIYVILYQYHAICKAEVNGGTSCILAFPTKEMRDAFYENFKELIEQCKELL